MKYKAEDYTYRVFWSPEDDAWIGVCEEFKSMSHIDEKSQIGAFLGMIDLLQWTLDDMHKDGEEPPAPAWTRSKNESNVFELTRDVRKRIYDSVAGVLPVERVILFGSYARGDYRADSDIDLYVIVTKCSSGFEDEVQASCALRWLYDYSMPTDVFALDEATFNARSKVIGTLEHVVAKEGVDLLKGVEGRS